MCIQYFWSVYTVLNIPVYSILLVNANCTIGPSCRLLVHMYTVLLVRVYSTGGSEYTILIVRVYCILYYWGCTLYSIQYLRSQYTVLLILVYRTAGPIIPYYWSLYTVLLVPSYSTSFQAQVLARKYGIPLTTLDVIAKMDIAIDGADEVDPHYSPEKSMKTRATYYGIP